MITRLWRWLTERLEDPRAPSVAVALGVMLVLGSLGNGLVLDDLYHRQVLVDGVGYLGEPRASWDLFSFFPERPGTRAEAQTDGLWPWWMGDVAVAFFRPIASLTHALDYALWPNHPWLMHVHSVIWYAALLAVAAVAYRRLLGPGLSASLACLLYALDGGHGIAVGWLATRNMVVAATFSIAALALHDAHRRHGFRHGAWLSPLALLLALCSAELAIGIFGYLIAYALFLDPARGWRRLRSLAPHLGVVVLWKAVYRALGFGSRGTGLYTHPFEAPGAFVEAIAERWPVLVTTQITLPFADFVGIPPAWADPIVAAAMVLIGAPLALYLFGPLVRSDPRARVLAAGALMAAVPCCTTLPHTRLLILVGFGFFGLLAMRAAQLVSTFSASEPRTETGTKPRGSLLTGLLLGRHLLLAPALLASGAVAPQMFGAILDRAYDTVPSGPEITDQTVVVVNAPHAFLASFVPIAREQRGEPAPHRLRTLGTTMGEVRVTRRDAQTLVLEAPGGYLEGRPHHMMWDPRDRRDPGYRVDLGDMTVEVVRSTEDGRPEAVLVHLEHPPGDGSHRWIVWEGDGFVPFTLPEPGETTILAPLDIGKVVLGAS